MWPFRIALGPFAVTPVELFAALGVGLAAWLTGRRLAPRGVEPGTVVDLALAALFGGAVGARLFYALPMWLRGLMEPGAILSGWSEGSGLIGGLLGGGAAVAAVARWKKLAVLEVFDAAAAALPVGYASGKVGCFLAGCCYGPRGAGLSFPPGSLVYASQQAAGEIPPDAACSLAVLPTPLLDLAFAAALFGALRWLGRRSPPPGAVFLAAMAAYAAWRFGIEFWRDDPGRHAFGASALSDSQIASIVLLAGAAAGGGAPVAPGSGCGAGPLPAEVVMGC